MGEAAAVSEGKCGEGSRTGLGLGPDKWVAFGLAGGSGQWGALEGRERGGGPEWEEHQPAQLSPYRDTVLAESEAITQGAVENQLT